MAYEEQHQHVALPKLYGAPAYARPPAAVANTPKPLDPDDLPLEAYQSPEEREVAERLTARSYPAGKVTFQGGVSDSRTAASGSRLVGRPFRLRALAGRFLGSPNPR